MDYYDAVQQVLERASIIKLPGRRLDVVTLARREFAKRGCCNAALIDPIEEELRRCLAQWSSTQKRQIWESTETGFESELDFNGYTIESMDLDLEGELMYHLLAELSLEAEGKISNGDEDDFENERLTRPLRRTRLGRR